LFGASRRQSSSLCLLNVIGSNQPHRATAGHILSDMRCLFSSNPLLLLLFHDVLNLPMPAVEKGRRDKSLLAAIESGWIS
jgi:hypothetical protein